MCQVVGDDAGFELATIALDFESKFDVVVRLRLIHRDPVPRLDCVATKIDDSLVLPNMQQRPLHYWVLHILLPLEIGPGGHWGQYDEGGGDAQVQLGYRH